MKKQIAAVRRSFAVQDPNTRKKFEFVRGEVIKGGPKFRLLNRGHLERGLVTFVDETNDSSVSRRLTGRTELHRTLGTDETMDLEWQVHQVMLSVFGNEALRGKGSAQVGMLETGIQLVKTDFASDSTIENFPGSDDVLAFREDNSRGRDIVWADSRLTVNKAISELVIHFESMKQRLAV
jgi:hypothetical protein